MSNVAELHLLNKRIEELEETVVQIDRGQTRQEEKLRDRMAFAFAASGVHPYEVYEMADKALSFRGVENKETPLP